MTNREAIRKAIDQARRAQIEEAGGYSALERDARQRDREIGTGPFLTVAGRRRIEELEAANLDLRRRLKNTQASLARTRRQRDHWKARADRKHPGWWHPKAAQLYKKGSTYTAIARRFDTDMETVIKVIARNGNGVKS